MKEVSALPSNFKYCTIIGLKNVAINSVNILLITQYHRVSVLEGKEVFVLFCFLGSVLRSKVEGPHLVMAFLAEYQGGVGSMLLVSHPLLIKSPALNHGSSTLIT